MCLQPKSGANWDMLIVPHSLGLYSAEVASSTVHASKRTEISVDKEHVWAEVEVRMQV